MKTFPVPLEEAVVTSIFVVDELREILEVSHQDDENAGSLWQFHSGNGDYTMSKMRLVQLSTILRIDPSVIDVADLQKGFVARHTARGEPWKIEPE